MLEDAKRGALGAKFVAVTMLTSLERPISPPPASGARLTIMWSG